MYKEREGGKYDRSESNTDFVRMRWLASSWIIGNGDWCWCPSREAMKSSGAGFRFKDSDFRTQLVLMVLNRRFAGLWGGSCKICNRRSSWTGIVCWCLQLAHIPSKSYSYSSGKPAFFLCWIFDDWMVVNFNTHVFFRTLQTMPFVNHFFVVSCLYLRM